MYLEHAHLTDIKCFADLRVKFTRGLNRNWNVILGENGTGKTSLLRAIAASLLDRPAAEKCLNPAGWVRTGRPTGTLSVDVVPTPNDEHGELPHPPPLRSGYIIVDANQEWLGRPFASATLVDAGIDLDSRLCLADWEFMNRYAFRRRPSRGWLLCAYGAFRRLAGSAHPVNLRDDLLVERVASLFDPNVGLTDCETWLKELDRRATKSRPDSPRQRVLADVKATLCELLPSVDEVSIGDEVELRFGDQTFRIGDLSDGHRSMFALTVDLLRWIEETRSGDRPPLREMEGVVLIDEVDAHLHPRWQREVGFTLTRTFPRLQFIVTSHSPFVAMAAGEGTVTVLKRNGDVVHADDTIPDVRGWAVDEVLTQVFGLDSLRDPRTAGELMRYQHLRLERGAGRLTAEQSQELAVLEARLSQHMAPDVHGS